LEEGKVPSSNSTQKEFLPFGVSWEGDTPFPLCVTPKCHSEGSPPFNEGFLLHPKNINGGDPSLRSG